MTTLLLLYQTELCEHLRAATAKHSEVNESLQRLRESIADPSADYVPPPASGPGSRSEQLREGLQRLSQARELLSHMHTEVNEQPSGERKKLQGMMQTYQREMERLEGGFTRLRGEAAAASNEDLMRFSRPKGEGLLDSRVDDVTEAQRRAAATTTIRLQGGTTHLARAEGLLHRSNVMGAETFQTLRGQTEQIRGVGSELQEVDEEISQATAIMRQMHRTALQHKLCLYGLAGLSIIEVHGVMSTLLQTYEEDFKESAKRVEDEISAIRITCQHNAADYISPPASGPMSRVRRCAEVGQRIAQIRDILSSMEYESHDVHASQRQTLRHRMTEYQNRVTRLEERLAEVKHLCSAADRQDLLSGSSAAPRAGEAGPRDGDPDEEHRRMMMDNTNKFRNASEKLQQAERVLNDTEKIGTSALQSLREQTEQLQSMHEVTIAVDDEISESRKILQRVHQGIVKQKATLIVIAGVLLFLIVVAIYVSVSKHRSTTATTVSPATTTPPVPPTYTTLPPDVFGVTTATAVI